MKKRLLFTWLLSFFCSSVLLSQHIADDMDLIITNMEQPVACRIANRNFQLVNNSGNDYHDVHLLIPKLTGVCYQHDGTWPVNVDPATGDIEIIIGFVPKLSSVSVMLSMQITCDLIPVTPATDPNTGAYQMFKLTEDFKVSHQVQNDFLEVIHEQFLAFPFLETSQAYTTNGTYTGHVGDTITRSVRFVNTGIASLENGSVKFFDNPPPSVEVQSIAVLVNGQLTYGPLPYGDFDFHIPLLEPGDSLTFVEKIKIIGCPESTGYSDIHVRWGCDFPDLCDINNTENHDQCFDNSIAYIKVQRGADRPKISVKRVLPAGPVVNENICYGGYTHYKYAIINDSIAGSREAVYQVTIGLSQVPVNYAVIDYSSIQINGAPATPGDIIEYNMPPYIIGYPQNPMFLNSYYNNHPELVAPDCMNNFPEALWLLQYNVDTLKVNDTIFIEFDVYRCCPGESGLQESGSAMLKFNHWQIYVTGKDECNRASAYGQPAYGGLNLSQNLDGELNAYLNPFDIALLQTFEPVVSDLTGGKAQYPGQPAPWYGEGATFSIDNLQFMRNGSLMGDTNLIHANAAQFKVVFEMEKGLHILPADIQDVRIEKGGLSWYPSQINDTDALIYGESTLTMIFDFEDLPGGSMPMTLLQVRDFLNGSAMYFRLTSYCTAMEQKTRFSVTTWLNPDSSSGCQTCWMALGRVSSGINVHCPGCVTPGIIIDAFTMDRISYGYEDQNNNGKSDSPNPVQITANYSKFDEIKKKRAVQGDTLQLVVSAHFEDGDPNLGVTYNQLKNNWSTNNLPVQRFEYIYLKQNIPFSGTSELDLILVDSVSLQISNAINNTNFTVYLHPSDINEIDRDGNVYYYKLNRSVIAASASAPLNFEFLPADVYTLTSTFVVCGNFLPPDPVNNPTVGSKKISEVVNDMYFTGENASISDDRPLGGDIWQQTGDINSMGTDLFYRCETYGGFYYFFSSEANPVFDWGKSVASCSNSLVTGLVLRLGGGQDNLFPYEYRASNSRIEQFNFTLPDNPYQYQISNILLKGSGESVSPLTGNIAPFYFNYTGTVSYDPNLSVNSIPFAASNFRLLNESDNTNALFNSAQIILGDEVSVFSAQVYLNTICGTFNGDITSKNVNSSMQLTSPGCSNPTSFFQGDSLYPFPQLKPDLSLVLPTSVEATSQCVCWEVEIHNGLNANSNLEYPFIYFPLGQDNPSVNSVLIAECPGGNCPPAGVCGTTGGYTALPQNGIYQIPGMIGIGAYRRLKICVQYNCSGDLGDHPVNFFYGGNCFDYPVSANDPDICNMKAGSLMIEEVDAAIEIDLSENGQDMSYTKCEENHVFRSCVKATRKGGIDDFIVDLVIPDQVIFDSTLVQATFIDEFGIESGIFTSYSNPVVNPITDTYTYNLSAYNSYFGAEQTLNLNEKLCFSFEIAPTCNYNGVMPEISFQGVSYCDQAKSTGYTFEPWSFVAATCSEACGPDCNLSVVCGSESQQLYANVTGALGPVTYTWTTNPPQYTQTTTPVEPGIYEVIVTDSAGCYSRCSVELFECYGMRTQTQGGWGSEPSGNNPGAYLHEPGRFENSFPDPDYLKIGCNKYLKLTSAQSVTEFLPCAGPPYILIQDSLIDPGQSYNNTFAAQIVALTISLKFDDDISDYGASGADMGDMIVTAGALQGMTVDQVMIAANRVFGSCPSSYTVSSMNWTLNQINNNFVDGTQDNGFLACGGSGTRDFNPNYTGSDDETGFLYVYPNPFMDEINIDFASEHGGFGRVEIIDMYGKRVDVLFEGVMESGATYNRKSVFTSLTAGIYICRFTDSKGQKSVKVVRY